MTRRHITVSMIIGEQGSLQTLSSVRENRTVTKSGEYLFRKHVNLCKNNGLWGFQHAPFPPLPLSSSNVALNTNRTQSQWKPAWQPLEGVDWDWSSFKAPFSEKCHLFGDSQGNPACMFLTFDLTQNSPSVKAFLPGLAVNKYQGQLFNIMISWDGG